MLIGGGIVDLLHFEQGVELIVDDEGCIVDTLLLDMPVSTAGCTHLRPPEPDAPQDKLEPGKTCTLEARASVIAPIWAQYGDMMVPIAADAVSENACACSEAVPSSAGVR